MTTTTIKTVLFASLIAAMILPFSTMDFAQAENEDKNPRDKTFERTQEKIEREKIVKELIALDTEEDDLKEKIESESDESEKQKIDKRLEEIESRMDEIEQDNHKRDIPQAQLEKLINQQSTFENGLIDSEVMEYVTSVGIDIASKEIQIGLNQDTVDSTNIDSIVTILEGLMPNDAEWHIVYSDVAETTSCDQKECTPLIGGNYIKVTGGEECSFGFQAKKGSTWGWITAGHCADGLVGNSVKDYSGHTVGTVSDEKFDWGTSCDCAWITASSSLTNNEVFDAPSTHTVTSTTQASQQQNKVIMQSGQKGGILFGTVSAINVSVYNITDGEYHKNLVRSDVTTVHGDSGGPVVEKNDRGDLYGIATTHDWWGSYHTPIDQITAHMGVSPVLN